MSLSLPIPPAAATVLLEAQVKAIAALSRLLDSTPNPREVRLIAAAILRFKLPGSPHAPRGVPTPLPRATDRAQPHSAPNTPHISPDVHPPQPRSVHTPREPNLRSAPLTRPSSSSSLSPITYPLTPVELSTLQSLLPQVKPARFTTKHTPAYWRGVITRNQVTTEAPSQHSGRGTQDSSLAPDTPP